jgi:SAM-dependent methyltransferase
MPEYDRFADVYQGWSAATSPYHILECYSFLRTLGSVQGLDILDLATGEGRTARMLMEGGARSVLGGDISPEMVRRASEQKTWPGLRYQVLDARDDDFQLDPPVDVVTAMYLLPYAPSEGDLDRMTRLIARNLRPGGRFVTYTVSPDYDFSRSDPRIIEYLEVDYAVADGNRRHFIIGDQRVDFWQWSRAAHEASLGRAGLADIRWHALEAPPEAKDVATVMAWYLENPSCTVLSATKPD